MRSAGDVRSGCRRGQGDPRRTRQDACRTGQLELLPMSLIDAVYSLCHDHLAGNGWDELLQEVGGLKIDQPTAAKLAAELARPLAAIDRTRAGFEDFALDGDRGIEPGVPARSLFYHA